MQTNAINATSQSITTTTTTPPVVETRPQQPSPKPVVTAAPPSLNQPTLNQPKSAQYQPKSSTTPSYSPVQPESVEVPRTNNKVAESEKASDIKTQQTKRPIQVADQRVASNVLTGEYSADATTRPTSPSVGGYVATRA